MAREEGEGYAALARKRRAEEEDARKVVKLGVLECEEEDDRYDMLGCRR